MAIEKATASSSLAEVIDRILDKGVVIDAFVRVSLVGIELLSIELRAVVASVETSSNTLKPSASSPSRCRLASSYDPDLRPGRSRDRSRDRSSCAISPTGGPLAKAADRTSSRRVHSRRPLLTSRRVPTTKGFTAHDYI